MTIRVRIFNESPETIIRAQRVSRATSEKIGHLPIYLGHEDEALMVLRDRSEAIQIIEIDLLPTRHVCDEP